MAALGVLWQETKIIPLSALLVTSYMYSVLSNVTSWS